jgi:hypothetical protein
MKILRNFLCLVLISTLTTNCATVLVTLWGTNSHNSPSETERQKTMLIANSIDIGTGALIVYGAQMTKATAFIYFGVAYALIPTVVFIIQLSLLLKSSLWHR